MFLSVIALLQLTAEIVWLTLHLSSDRPLTVYCNVSLQNRVFNARAPFQGSVHPLVLKASINDTKKGLVVSTRRPVGVFARNGSMEYLPHRYISMQQSIYTALSKLPNVKVV